MMPLTEADIMERLQDMRQAHNLWLGHVLHPNNLKT